MSTSQTIAPYLPFLRRYARALTGNQTSGDAYVAAALEALIEDPTVLEGPASPRVALYRLFTKIWNSVVVNGSGGVGSKNLPAEQRFRAVLIGLVDSQAFRLAAETP